MTLDALGLRRDFVKVNRLSAWLHSEFSGRRVRRFGLDRPIFLWTPVERISLS
jgi:hypothetical protein